MAKRGSGGGGRGGGTKSVKLDTSGLSGSTKQVAYATDILEGHFLKFDAVANNFRKDIRYGKNSEYTKIAERAANKVAEMKNAEISTMNKAIKSGNFSAATIIDRKSRLASQTSIQDRALDLIGVPQKDRMKYRH